MTDRPHPAEAGGLATPRPTWRVALVLLLSGAVGFLLGAEFRPLWQDAIEPAQVLAGLVRYAPDNPVYLYSTRTWTLLHQIPAALLWAGVSERVLTWLLSGLLGLVSFQALALTVYALSEDIVLASLAPAFIYVTQATAGGVTYPVALMGVPATYGIVGLSSMLLVLALLGCGEYRTGGLLLGLLPALHISVGIWTWIVVAVVTATDAANQRAAWGPARRWVAAGLGVTLVSAGLHFISYPPVHVADPATTAQYLTAIRTYWDGHRQPFAPISGQTSLVTLCAALAGCWLWRYRREVPRASRTLLTGIVVAPVIGGVLAGWRLIETPRLPDALWMLMPSRLLNLPVLAAMAIVIGLAGRSRALAFRWILCALVVSASLLAVTEWFPVTRTVYAGMLVAAIALVAASEFAARRPLAAKAAGRSGAWLYGITLATTAAVTMALCGAALRQGPLVDRIADRTNDDFLAAIASRPGILLTASDIHLFQAITRRPVLIDGGALDGLGYYPDGGPAAERILSAVYGVSLLHPPPVEAGAIAIIAPDTGRALWESRAPAAWQDLGERFGVTDVVTYASWTLQLRVVARTDDFILYAIR